MLLEVLGGGAILLRVQDHVDVALPIQLHRLGPVPPGMAEAQAAQEPRQLRACSVIDGELQELDAVQRRGRGQAGATPGLGLGQNQRAQPVAGVQPGRRGAEIVVEHLQR